MVDATPTSYGALARAPAVLARRWTARPRCSAALRSADKRRLPAVLHEHLRALTLSLSHDPTLSPAWRSSLDMNCRSAKTAP